MSLSLTSTTTTTSTTATTSTTTESGKDVVGESQETTEAKNLILAAEEISEAESGGFESRLIKKPRCNSK